jgi:3-phenylpropionate/trans-cinnamate dioxygenase ferredoxin subunit
MAAFITVARVNQVPPGQQLQVKVGKLLISLWNLDGTLYAINDICSHEEEYLSEGEVVNHCCVECPKHGAQFDLRTGAALTLPATEPVATYPVRIEGDDIQIAVG